jgi:hypothetical protein
MLPPTEGNATLHNVLGMLGGQFQLISMAEMAFNAGVQYSYKRPPSAPGAGKTGTPGHTLLYRCVE